MIAGRNFVHTAVDYNNKHYFEIADRYNLATRMTKLNQHLAIQGEITGPKIGGNRHSVTENKFHVFNIYSIDQ